MISSVLRAVLCPADCQTGDDATASKRHCSQDPHSLNQPLRGQCTQLCRRLCRRLC